MSVVVVYNPKSRRGRSTANRTRSFLERSGIGDRALWMDIKELGRVEDLEAPHRVIAIGGDGTINAVADWLLRSAFSSQLAIIPAGTGNNLARGLGIGTDWRVCMERALHGKEERRIDVIRLETPGARARDGSCLPASRLILQGGAWGFPATVAGRFAALREHRLFRWIAYPMGGSVYRLLALGHVYRQWREECGEKPDHLLLKAVLPGETLEAEALAVFVGNEPTLGGGFHPCPRASVDDGLLDLCIVRARSGEPLLGLLGKVAAGEHLALTSAVDYRQSPGPVELHFRAATAVVVDGEIVPAADTWRLELLPGALRIVVA